MLERLHYSQAKALSWTCKVMMENCLAQLQVGLREMVFFSNVCSFKCMLNVFQIKIKLHNVERACICVSMDN